MLDREPVLAIEHVIAKWPVSHSVATHILGLLYRRHEKLLAHYIGGDIDDFHHTVTFNMVQGLGVFENPVQGHITIQRVFLHKRSSIVVIK